MSKFIEMSRQYTNIKREIVDTLMGLAQHCNSITVKYPNLFEQDVCSSDHQFEFYSNEEYVSHQIHDDEVILNLEYEDPYDDICNSDSRLFFPIKWINMWVEGNIEELNLLIRDVIVEDSKAVIYKNKSDILNSAKLEGLLTQEEFDKKMSELYLTQG